MSSLEHRLINPNGLKLQGGDIIDVCVTHTGSMAAFVNGVLFGEREGPTQAHLAPKRRLRTEKGGDDIGRKEEGAPNPRALCWRQEGGGGPLGLAFVADLMNTA